MQHNNSIFPSNSKGLEAVHPPPDPVGNAVVTLLMNKLLKDVINYKIVTQYYLCYSQYKCKN